MMVQRLGLSCWICNSVSTTKNDNILCSNVLITQKNPFKKEKCGENNCPLCKTGTRLKAFCNTNNVGYRWTCDNCKDKDLKRVYEGESSRSARIRAKEHIYGLKNKLESTNKLSNLSNIYFLNIFFQKWDQLHVANSGTFQMKI